MVAMTHDNRIGILVADRNPRVRAFLQREMMAAGYRVTAADSARDVLRWAAERDRVDLVIIDPDLPDAEPEALVAELRRRRPQLPVVIHALPDPERGPADPPAAGFVEKGARSVERLQTLVRALLPRA